MAIRYDKKLNREINRTIRNFNQKISRLEKEEKELLPKRITKKEIKENYKNRNILKRKLKELQRFSKRGIEEVFITKGKVRTTKYELENLKKESARIKRKLTANIKWYEIQKPNILGKEQFDTFARMGDSTYLNLKAKRELLDVNIEELNEEEFENYQKQLEKYQKNEEYYDDIFKENYLKILTDLGYFIGYNMSRLEYLKDKLRKIKSREFYELFKKEKAIQAILDYYLDMKKFLIDPDTIISEVTTLYDALIDNIDFIIESYA